MSGGANKGVSPSDVAARQAAPSPPEFPFSFDTFMDNFNGWSATRSGGQPEVAARLADNDAGAFNKGSAPSANNRTEKEEAEGGNSFGFLLNFGDSNRTDLPALDNAPHSTSDFFAAAAGTGDDSPDNDATHLNFDFASFFLNREEKDVPSGKGAQAGSVDVHVVAEEDAVATAATSAEAEEGHPSAPQYGLSERPRSEANRSGVQKSDRASATPGHAPESRTAEWAAHRGSQSKLRNADDVSRGGAVSLAAALAAAASDPPFAFAHSDMGAYGDVNEEEIAPAVEKGSENSHDAPPLPPADEQISDDQHQSRHQTSDRTENEEEEETSTTAQKNVAKAKENEKADAANAGAADVHRGKHPSPPSTTIEQTPAAEKPPVPPHTVMQRQTPTATKATPRKATLSSACSGAAPPVPVDFSNSPRFPRATNTASATTTAGGALVPPSNAALADLIAEARRVCARAAEIEEASSASTVAVASSCLPDGGGGGSSNTCSLTSAAQSFRGSNLTAPSITALREKAALTDAAFCAQVAQLQKKSVRLSEETAKAAAELQSQTGDLLRLLGPHAGLAGLVGDRYAATPVVHLVPFLISLLEDLLEDDEDGRQGEVHPPCSMVTDATTERK